MWAIPAEDASDVASQLECVLDVSIPIVEPYDLVDADHVQRGVWAFPIQQDGSLGERKLIKQFPDHGFDGMRCDVDGNLYITRHGKGTVVKLSPKGDVLREIDVLGPHPTNICFGGEDLTTIGPASLLSSAAA